MVFSFSMISGSRDDSIYVSNIDSILDIFYARQKRKCITTRQQTEMSRHLISIKGESVIHETNLDRIISPVKTDRYFTIKEKVKR